MAQLGSRGILLLLLEVTPAHQNLWSQAASASARCYWGAQLNPLGCAWALAAQFQGLAPWGFAVCGFYRVSPGVLSLESFYRFTLQ